VTVAGGGRTEQARAGSAEKKIHHGDTEGTERACALTGPASLIGRDGLHAKRSIDMRAATHLRALRVSVVNLISPPGCS